MAMARRKGCSRPEVSRSFRQLFAELESLVDAVHEAGLVLADVRQDVLKLRFLLAANLALLELTLDEHLELSQSAVALLHDLQKLGAELSLAGLAIRIREVDQHVVLRGLKAE